MCGRAGLEEFYYIYGNQTNENSTVTSLVKEDEAREAEIEELLENKFDGSCPDFLAAFIRKGKLSDKDIEELQTMIDNLRAQ